jgi:hypothetical protein
MSTSHGWWVCLAGLSMACASAARAPGADLEHPVVVHESSGTFADDLAFLRKHGRVVVLRDTGGQAQVIVAPEYQGRVMTSTAAGGTGASFGFIHREVVAKRERAPHINVFGGEDRFWLGPEAGQYGLYFAPGAPFDLEHWQVPEPIDWGGWSVTSQTSSEVRLARALQLTNYSRTTFVVAVERSVRVLERAAIESAFGVTLPSALNVVGFESVNQIRNTGDAAWTPEQGLLSVWILGMFKPSPQTTVVIPFHAGPQSELGPIVNDAYFGKVPADRLRIEDGVMFFRGDGAQRGKIGIPRPRARSLLGAYDPKLGLTLVQYTLEPEATDYVNSVLRARDVLESGRPRTR